MKPDMYVSVGHVQVCTTLEELPRERYVFMKLAYTDDTPADYEPPYFRKLDDQDASHFPSRPFDMYVPHILWQFLR